MGKFKDNLGDRMKGYENASKMYLQKRLPTIIRLDGKAFHTFTKGFKNPYDEFFNEAMLLTSKDLANNIQGCKLAYTQSDEISLLLTDYDKLTTSSWFGKGIQKMVSVAASMATLYFNKNFKEIIKEANANSGNNGEFDIHISKFDTAMFDARVFNLSKDEVCNYFVWRQMDATRNSIRMLGQVYFSSKSLHGVNNKDLLDMLIKKGVNWSDQPIKFKRGICVVDGKIDLETPVFTQDRRYIENFVYINDGFKPHLHHPEFVMIKEEI